MTVQLKSTNCLLQLHNSTCMQAGRHALAYSLATACKLTSRRVGRQAGRRVDRQAGWETGRQVGRQTGRQAGRQVAQTDTITSTSETGKRCDLTCMCVCVSFGSPDCPDVQLRHQQITEAWQHLCCHGNRPRTMVSTPLRLPASS